MVSTMFPSISHATFDIETTTNHIRQTVLLALLVMHSIVHAEKLEPSQLEILMTVKLLLNSPPSLHGWNNDTDFCGDKNSTTNIDVICDQGNVTELHIVGDLRAPRLPNNFSINSFIATLVNLPNLKALTLVSLGLWGRLPNEVSRLSSLKTLNLSTNFFDGDVPTNISSLTQLQTLVLDGNSFNGILPNALFSLSTLSVLSVSNNSFFGSLPPSLGSLLNLKVLILSNNNFSGEIPDLRNLTNLQVVDVENNTLGPTFPLVRERIEKIVLRNNVFAFGVLEEVKSYHQLKVLDISYNRFIGPFDGSLFSLPSISYLNIAENEFTGMLNENMSCSNGLEFVNLSANFLTGKLPNCLVLGSTSKIVVYAENCLEGWDENQRPVSFCKNGPRSSNQKLASKVVLGLSICGGVVGSMVLIGATIIVVKKFIAKGRDRKSRVSIEDASIGYTMKFFKDARYITQAMKVGALGLPAYRTFSLEELKEATCNFDASTFMGEESHFQIYRGQLKDGLFVTVRCIELKRSRNIQQYMSHVETISKLRHHHLASVLGHCFELNTDGSTVRRIFLVFEYVSNKTLRRWMSEKRARGRFSWSQRIAAATGVAKGIQFLHTGIVPSLYCNNIKTTHVLVDQNHAVKITSYHLPFLEENADKVKKDSKGINKYKDKTDIYAFGLILLELISGKPVDSSSEIKSMQEQSQFGKSLVDEAIRESCSTESMKTTIDICHKCLLLNAAERPSIEDVLWNLQFAAQVHDAYGGDMGSNDQAAQILPPRSLYLNQTIEL